jgi:hypothetical protein
MRASGFGVHTKQVGGESERRRTRGPAALDRPRHTARRPPPPLRMRSTPDLPAARQHDALVDILCAACAHIQEPIRLLHVQRGMPEA